MNKVQFNCYMHNVEFNSLNKYIICNSEESQIIRDQIINRKWFDTFHMQVINGVKAAFVK